MVCGVDLSLLSLHFSLSLFQKLIMFDREPPSEKERKKKMMAPCLLTEIKSEDEDAENFHESA